MPNIQIQILSTDNKTVPTSKGSYNMLEVVFKNLTYQGKVEPKKLASFGASGEAYKVLAGAKQGEVYEVDYTKNDKGFNDWTQVNRSTTAVASPTGSTTTTGTSGVTGGVQTATSPRSTYETSEERAKKQIYIVRQSSISNAIAVLTVGAKTHPKSNEILDLAKTFENYVFGSDVVTPEVQTAAHAKDVAASFDDLEDPIPF